MEKLSDREFIEKWKPVSGYILNDIFQDALVRLEALVKANEERDYTPEEALEETRKRWPEFAWCAHIELVSYNATKFKCTVGYMQHEGNTKMFRGDSFRDAFASADKAKEGQ